MTTKYINQLNKYRVHILVIFVSVFVGISYVFNRLVRHPLRAVMKCKLKDFVVHDMSAVRNHKLY